MRPSPERVYRPTKPSQNGAFNETGAIGELIHDLGMSFRTAWKIAPDYTRLMAHITSPAMNSIYAEAGRFMSRTLV